MDLLSMLFNDPVVMFAFGGLAIMFGICTYHAYYLFKRMKEDSK